MSEPFEREIAVFSAARRLPAEGRAAYLEQTCAGDAALRQRVEALLQASEEAGPFLHEPAPGAQRPVDALSLPETVHYAKAPGEKAGDRIGQYKLLQQIGEGGCGVVFMAEQEQPGRRRVALKVIKLGVDTNQGGARFVSSSWAWTRIRWSPGSKPSAKPWRSWTIRTSPKSSTRARPIPDGHTLSWSWCAASKSRTTATRTIFRPKTAST